MSRSNVTYEQALSRLVAEVKLLNADEVGERWNQLGGELAVAEGVLRDGVDKGALADEIVAALDALQTGCREPSWIGWQNGDGEEVGTRLDAALAAYKAGVVPVAAQPVEPRQLAPELREVLRDSLASNMGGLYYCDRVWSAWNVGTMTQDDFTEAAEIDDILENLCDVAIAVLGGAAPVAGSAAPSGEAWKPIETAPKDGTRFLGVYEGKVGFWHWQGNPSRNTRPEGWRDSFLYVYKEGDGPTHWMPIPDIATITATKE